jgi:3D (Asp-Asp-Asp) domain-containing protein
MGPLPGGILNFHLIKHFVFICILLSTLKSYSAENYYGDWQGKRYDLYLSEISDNIYGSYDNNRLDFYVKNSTKNIYGQILSGRLDIYVLPNTENIYGTHPCGRVDFYYKILTNNIYGTYCGNHIDIYYRTAEETLSAASDMLKELIIVDFPFPVKSVIQQFILKRIQL